jgi:hypothetical protein
METTMPQDHHRQRLFEAAQALSDVIATTVDKLHYQQRLALELAQQQRTRTEIANTRRRVERQQRYGEWPPSSRQQ